MKRYHQKICFPEQYDKELNSLTDGFNSGKKFKYTTHAYFNLKQRFDYMGILKYLAYGIVFNKHDIFEYYTDDNMIVKICYKMGYDGTNDLIIVLDRHKTIITVYLNSKGDNHSTLKNELYSTV